MSHTRTHAKRCGYGRKNGDGSLNNDFPSVVFHDDKFFKRLIFLNSHSLSLERGWGEAFLCAILEEFQDQSSFSFSEPDIQSVPAHEWQS